MKREEQVSFEIRMTEVEQFKLRRQIKCKDARPSVT
jgi:hypothetical protein